MSTFSSIIFCLRPGFSLLLGQYISTASCYKKPDKIHPCGRRKAIRKGSAPSFKFSACKRAYSWYSGQSVIYSCAINEKNGQQNHYLIFNPFNFNTTLLTSYVPIWVEAKLTRYGGVLYYGLTEFESRKYVTCYKHVYWNTTDVNYYQRI